MNKRQLSTETTAPSRKSARRNLNMSKESKKDLLDKSDASDYVDSGDEQPNTTTKQVSKQNSLLSLYNLVSSLPLIHTRKRITYPVYVETMNRTELLIYLHSEQVLARNLFKKLIELSNERILLVILSDETKYEELKDLLKDKQVVFHLKNPSKSLNSKSLLLTDFQLLNPTKELLKEELISRNVNLDLNNDSFRVSKLYIKSKPHCAVIDVVSKGIYDKLLEVKEVQISASRADIYQFAHVTFCDKCCQFGHSSQECTYLVTICLFCGGVDHLFKGCKLKDQRPVCFNCNHLGIEEKNHLASSIFCFYRLSYIAEYLKKLETIS